MRWFLLLTLLVPPSAPPKVLLKVETSAGRVQPYLPVHLLLVREDGAETKLPLDTAMQCEAAEHYLVCDGIEYKINGVTFEVAQ